MRQSELTTALEKVIENVPNFPKKGIQFKDISPIFQHPDLYKKAVQDLADFSKDKIDVVCGIESRGFLFGISVAMELNIPFVLIRKKGKLPPPVISQAYDLEYGSSALEMKVGQIFPGQRVLIHDDLLATGGTTEAAARLIQKQKATVAQFSFLISLEALKGQKKLEPFGAEILYLLSY